MTIPIIQVGSIWKEVDPRFDRFVKVIASWSQEGKAIFAEGHDGVSIKHGGITIITVDPNTGDKTAGSRPTSCKPERFNGKRGGYALHKE